MVFRATVKLAFQLGDFPTVQMSPGPTTCSLQRERLLPRRCGGR